MKPNVKRNAKEFAHKYLADLPPLIKNTLNLEFVENLLARSYMEGAFEMAKYFDNNIQIT